MTIKMRDIAKDLGVSVITVSKVLRNHPEVGHATRERVLARVKELDYRPNLAARSLVTGRTYLVGLIVTPLAGIGRHDGSPHSGSRRSRSASNGSWRPLT